MTADALRVAEAAERFGLAPGATSEERAAAVLRALEEHDFHPPADVAEAAEVVLGVRSSGDPAPALDAAGEWKVAQAIEAFAQEYWVLSPDDRRGRFNALWVDAAPSVRNLDRLRLLKGGLDEILPAADANRVVRRAMELYPLPPSERAIRRRDWLRWAQPSEREIRSAEVTLKQYPEDIAAVAEEFRPVKVVRSASPGRAPVAYASSGGSGSSNKFGWMPVVCVVVGIALVRVCTSGVRDRGDKPPRSDPAPSYYNRGTVPPPRQWEQERSPALERAIERERQRRAGTQPAKTPGKGTQ